MRSQAFGRSGGGPSLTVGLLKLGVQAFRRSGMRKASRGLWVALASLGVGLVLCGPALAQGSGLLPQLQVTASGGKGGSDVALPLQILALLTILSVAPAIVMMMTSFTRIVIVLGLTRSAIGAQQIPPNQVLMGLALCLTFFTMQPTLKQVNDQALQPYLNKRISAEKAMDKAIVPVRGFMLRQTRENDLALFVELSRLPRPRTARDVPTYVLVPAFIISELKTAFTMGFVIFLPFLVIDIVVSMILMSMGMMMLPPVMISLPFKLLLFVMVDGWNLLTRALALSFS
jgi:flagellar biosynthetic protein FliP